MFNTSHNTVYCARTETIKDNGTFLYWICRTCQTYERRIEERCIRCYICKACGVDGKKHRIDPDTRTHYYVTQNDDGTYIPNPEKCRIIEKK